MYSVFIFLFSNLININSITGQYQINGLITSNVEQLDLIPMPIVPVSVTVATTAPTGYNGAIYYINMPVKYNKIIVNVNSFSASSTGTVLIYQRNGGLAANTANPANLISSGSFNATSAVSVAVTPTGTNKLSPGVAYILYGKKSTAIWTYSTYTASFFNTLNNLLITGAPTNFSIATLSASSPPVTFDPTSATAGTINPLTCRLSA